MSKIVSQVRNLGSKTAEVFNAPFRKLTGWMLSIYTLPMVMAPTMCAKIKSNIDMDTLFGSMADIIIKLAFYVGVLFAISGIFQLVNAYRDDNSGEQPRAARSIVVGVCLIGFETILRIAGIIA